MHVLPDAVADNLWLGAPIDRPTNHPILESEQIRAGVSLI
jgi:hypothetical protein